jgi:putative oxidoreductase
MNLFSTKYSQKTLDFWLLILRLCVAGFMLTHGFPKLMKLFSGDEIQFMDVMGIGATGSLALAVFSEFVCSVLIAFGLATRFAAFALICTMMVAAFMAHGADPFAKKELALLYLLIYVTILVTGSGKYSLDHYLNKNKKRR